MSGRIARDCNGGAQKHRCISDSPSFVRLKATSVTLRSMCNGLFSLEYVLALANSAVSQRMDRTRAPRLH